MIYLDTSVAMAYVLTEATSPPSGMWRQPLVASRLIEYEIWTRLNARSLSRSHGDIARWLTGRVAIIELTPAVLARALETFPVPLRTLDALHLASILFLIDRGQDVTLATYDRRMAAAATALGISLFDLRVL